jgi:hypothetical protein
VPEPRPVALPPAERTVGQLVAESVRFYGDHFWPSLALGVAPAVAAVLGAQLSQRTTLIVLPTVFGALLSAAYVYACVLVLNKPTHGRLAVAWLGGWIVFAPVAPLIRFTYVLPGVIWLLAFALLVPVLVAEPRPVSASVGRALRLVRADYVHEVGSLLTLAILAVLTQAVIAFTLRGFADSAVWVAYFLAATVVSPLLFLGSALLYVDQAARAEVD